MSKPNRPGQKIILKSVEELLGVFNEEAAMDIEIDKIRPFRNHPFKVVDDDRMQDLVQSIRDNGILSPTLIRPVGPDQYEMISGHRRMFAASVIGLERIPAIIREMTDDEATVMMVDANIQREELLPSEKAYAYRMKLEAMKRQGKRNDLTLGQNGPKLAVDEISKESGDSSRQIKRFIRLTELIPELLDMVDKKRIQFMVGVEISFVDPEIQKWIYEYIRENGQVKLNQVTAVRSQIQGGAITQAKLISILNSTQPGRIPAPKVVLTEKRLRKYFPEDYTVKEMRNVIEDLLEKWKTNMEDEEQDEI